MTMAWLESQLRQTDIYQDSLWADQIAQILEVRREDIPLPNQSAEKNLGAVAINIEAGGQIPDLKEVLTQLPGLDNKPRTPKNQAKANVDIFAKRWKKAAGWSRYLTKDTAGILLVELGLTDDTEIAIAMLDEFVKTFKTAKNDSEKNKVRLKGAVYGYGLIEGSTKDTQGYFLKAY